VETVWKIQKALDAAGIELIPEEAGRGGRSLREVELTPA